MALGWAWLPFVAMAGHVIGTMVLVQCAMSESDNDLLKARDSSF
jgi:hypothetical protein